MISFGVYVAENQNNNYRKEMMHQLEDASFIKK